jgi:hypothetical protein
MTDSLFIDIQDAIVARLTAKLAALNPAPKIYEGRDMEDVKRWSQGDLSVFVAYNGITETSALSQAPHVVTLGQDWYIWTVARSAKNHRDGSGNREAADPVMKAILQALTGWMAAPGVRLELKPNPGPAYGDGFGWFPLVYGAKRQIRGDTN